MDRMNEYRELVKRIICEHAEFKPSFGDIEVETVFDDERGHYELLVVGWDRAGRVDGNIIHIDVRNGKIWIQHDGTEEGIANQLLAAGVPHEHIVLGFHPPNMRKHTPFAVA